MNSKISQFDPYTTGDLPDLDQSYIFMVNPTTKEARIINWRNFQKILGQEDANVGINNVNPLFKLDVSGNARIQDSLFVEGGIVVGSTGVEPQPFSLAVSGDLGLTGKIYSLNDTGLYIDLENEDRISVTIDEVVQYDIAKTGSQFYMWFNPSGADVDFIIGTSGGGVNHPYPEYTLHVDGETSRVGVGTNQPQAKLHVYGINFAAGTGAFILNDYTGIALLDGQVTANWGIAAQKGEAGGNYSVAFQESVATGDYSFAMGLNSTGYGGYSMAVGLNAFASGYGSTAIGNGVQALGTYSFAEGYNSVAEGIGAHAEGVSTNAESLYSHAEGYQSTAQGSLGAHAEGHTTLASGQASHSEGQYTFAIGDATHSEGYFANASGDYSHAEGQSTIAKGVGAHAQGYQTEADGDYSFAAGKGSTASGEASVALGQNSLAASTAELSLASNEFEYRGDAQTSVYNLMLNKSGYTEDVKYKLTIGNDSATDIPLDPNSMYSVKVFMNGRGALLSTQRITGSSVNWGYKMEGHISTKKYEDVVYPITGVEPYMTTWPASPVHGSYTVPTTYAPTETTFLTNTDVLITPNQYNEIPGFVPYMEFSTGTMELLLGVSRTDDWSYYEVGAVIAGNDAGQDTYFLVPSVLPSFKNAESEALTFDDVSGLFTKDASYFLNTYGYALDTNYQISGLSAGVVSYLDINEEGGGPTGTSDLTAVVAPATGMTGLCYAKQNLDCHAYWHATVIVNKLTSSIQSDGVLSC